MPSSSLFLRSSATLVSALSLLSVSSATLTPSQYYALDTTYQGASFFDGFSFFSAADPTHGFVDYLSRADAQNARLISSGNGQAAKMKVDASTPLTPPQSIDDYYNKDGVGRKSVRIESTKRWTHGLIVLDLAHMPTSAKDGCGTWPAFWTLGSGTWPQNGELDILEGANDQVNNFAAGHTGSADQTRQCSITNNGGSGDLIYSNCNLYTTDPFGNPTNPTGCKIEDTTATSYGKPFNDNNGGVYAMEWTSKYIKTFFFPRGSIPSDVAAGKPDPSKWTPFGVFSTPCDIDSNYNDMQIIFDTTFCGDFGDATWGSSCAAKTGFDTCAKYVASKPRDFAEAYWEIESLNVYTLKDKPFNNSSTTTSTTSTTTPYSFSPSGFTYSTWADWSSTSSPVDPTTTTTSTSTSSWEDWSKTSSPVDPTTTTSTSTSSWEDWSKTSSPVDPTTTTSTSTSSWEDWSKTSSPVDPTTTTSTSTSSWEDWSKTSSPVDPTTTTTSYSSWEDWSSSTSSPAVSTKTTTSYDPSHTWADWESSSTPAVVTSTSSYDPSHTWADWESSSTPAVVTSTSSYDPSTTWADWQASSASIGLTTLTVQPTPSVPAADTGAWPADASASGVSPASYGGSEASGVSPDVATYTGAAVKNGLSMAIVAIAGAVVLV